MKELDRPMTSLEEVLADSHKFDDVIVIGINNDNPAVHCISTMSYAPDMLWAIEVAKQNVMYMRGTFND